LLYDNWRMTGRENGLIAAPGSYKLRNYSITHYKPLSMILTRKIQIQVDSADKAFVSECWTTLLQWQYTCFRAANYIFTHYFLQEQIKDITYLHEGVKAKLADCRKDPDGILTSSKMNTVYQVMSKHFKGSIPMSILNCLNMTMTKNFNLERQAYLNGERALRNYKRSIPIPFRGSDIRRLHQPEGEPFFRFNLFHLPLRTYLGRDKTDKRLLLEQLVRGQIQLHTSHLIIAHKKLFWMAYFEVEKEQHTLDSSIIAEAVLSPECPITVRIGKAVYRIGSKEEFLHRRLAIQAARNRMQRGSSYNRPQHGLKRKLKGVEDYDQKEYRYVTDRLHLYSRRLVDICLHHKAGSLLLVNQQENEAAAKEDPFLLRNWSYYQLKEKIQYKAEKAGILLIEE